MLLTLYISFIGLLVGSAINAIVWRLFVGRSWVRGRSICPECEHKLAPRDLVPVFSWLMLRGKCRYCRVPIHWQYPVVELLTAVLFGLSAARLSLATPQLWVTFALWISILVLLIILAVYDARWLILPDKVLLPAILLTVIYQVVLAARSGFHGLFGPVVAALLVGGAFFAIVYFSGGRAMGGGDIKLAFMMGLLLGLKGTALAMLIAFNSAALVGILLIILRLRSRRDHIAFGPFLVLGTIVAFLYGPEIINWYMRANGLII